jgi:hypothetical protein
VQEQKRQEGALRRTGDAHDPAVLLDLQRPEDAQLRAPLRPPLAGAFRSRKAFF